MAHWDEMTDVLVVGSGGGGMTAALAAHEKGARALVLEKGTHYGGTTAMSGGALWVPCNHLMAAKGIPDSRDEALTYLQTITKGAVSTERLAAYVDGAPAMLQFLEEKTHARFDAMESYADYYPEERGGKPGARTVEARVFAGGKLGPELDTLHPPHPQEMVMGRISLTAREAHIALTGGFKGQMLVTWRMLAYFLNLPARIRYSRNDRLTLGNSLSGRLRFSMLQRDIPLWLRTRVTGLVTEGGRVVGVNAERDGRPIRIRAEKGVILAAGGFARNEAMRKEYQRAPIGTEWTAAGFPDEGDAIRMAREPGAGVELMDEAWWTPTTVVPDKEYPWLIIVEKSLPGCMLVDGHGKRFTNEAAPYIDVVNDMYANHEHTGAGIPAYLIVDRRFRKRYPLGPLLPGTFEPEVAWRKKYLDTWIFKGNTPAELAEKLGIDPGGLEETFGRFNRMAATGKDEDFRKGDSAYDRYYGDPRAKPNPCLAPLTEAPFYGIRVWPGDLGTKGGLKTDAAARVLQDSGEVIPGLYATGNCSAAVMGRTYPGAGGTIGPAMTFGYLAAVDAVTRGQDHPVSARGGSTPPS